MNQVTVRGIRCFPGIRIECVPSSCTQLEGTERTKAPFYIVQIWKTVSSFSIQTNHFHCHFIFQLMLRQNLRQLEIIMITILHFHALMHFLLFILNRLWLEGQDV